MIKILKHKRDEMTPAERKKAIESGESYDRIPCVPFMGEFACQISGVSIREYWHDARAMADTQIQAFNRFGHDRLVIGPNSYGITEALGGKVLYPEQGLPYMKELLLKDYYVLDKMRVIDAGTHPRIAPFLEAASILAKEALPVVPVEASAGGPLTIAANLRGTERLLRDLRKEPEQVHRLLRIITDSEKSCIKEAAGYGLGIALADPVANPELVGPEYYEEFAFPYMKELTDYVFEISSKKASLHMCGKTYAIWNYFTQLTVNEVSLDNIIDLDRAREELSPYIPIAGNVPPVEVVMNGTKADVFASVEKCVKEAAGAGKGYVLATGCEVPLGTEPVKIDWFMEAVRIYGKVQDVK